NNKRPKKALSPKFDSSKIRPKRCMSIDFASSSFDIECDAQLLNIVSNLENGDELHLYIQHIVLDPEVVDDVPPTRLIGGPEEREEVVAETEISENVVDESEVREEAAAETEIRENVVDESEVREEEDVAAETEVREDDVTNLDGAISDLDSSSDSEFDVVPDEDDSDADEELIAVRNAKRTKLKARRRKKPTVHVEVPLGEGKIDRDFEDIGKNKADKYDETWITDISPMARVILEENKELSRKCKVLWFGTDGFEVDEYEYRYIVNLRRRTCTCRSWQLRGIPCAHAICAIYHQEEEPYNYVDHWYRKETFLKAYQYFLEPIPNMKMWPDTNNMVIEPPAPKPMPARPQKKRRKAKNEPNKKKYGKLSKQGVKMTCSKCHQGGHNKSTCQSMGEMGESTQAIQQSQGSQATQESTVTNRGSGRGRGKSANTSTTSGRGRGNNTSFGRGAFRNAPPPTAPRKLTVGVKRTRGRCAESATPSDGHKRSRNVGFGCYTNPTTGMTIINPGSSGERVVSYGTKVVKDTSAVNIDLGFKPPGLKFKGRNAITTSQLQQLSANKRSQIGTSTTTSSVASPATPAP
ncbi:hypothetical protein A4A49_03157, partial [Nicotiana attenuata]